MRGNRHKFGVVMLAIATAITFAIPSVSYAQRGGGGGGGGRGGEGQGGGRGGGNSGGGRNGGQSGESGRGGGRDGGGGGQSSGGGRRGGGTQAGDNRGGNDAYSRPNWSGSGNGRDNRQYGGGNDRGNQYYGGANRGNDRSGYSNLNQFYGGRYSSGYRGNNFGYGGGYGRPGFGPSFGNYGYGYFPWYIGLATYGAGVGRGYGYGGNSGYATQNAPLIVERTVESSTQQAAAPENDYVPQMNSTTTVLGAQSSGAAVLGVIMDPQYPNAAVVRQVTPGSAAEKGGLRAGDMLTTIDKTEIRSPADVTNLVANKQAGEQLEIAFIRPVLRSEVKEAAPEQGLGIPAPLTSEPDAATAPAERISAEPIAPPAPPVPTPAAN